jgi:MoaA/NifB/PqqE/SkfB family radical SAM enzyme
MNKLFLRVYYELVRLVTKKPFITEVDITDRCNLRCSHCYHFQEKDNSEDEPDLAQWEKRFKKLYSEGIRMIMLMGGEPLLRPDVIKLADSIFPFVEMITNGTIPLPENYDHRIFVSIDGGRETNDKIRGKGVFDKVVQNVKGDERVVFNMTLLESNFKELEYVVELSEKIGISGVVCNMYTAVENGEKALKNNVRRNIVKELRRVKKLKPGTLLFTEDAIKWFEDADHRDSCYWRDQVLHFDTDLNPRRCFATSDCSKCGCYAGAMGSPFGSFKKLPGLFKLSYEILKKRLSE